MVGSRKYLVAVSGIIFVVLVTASCARQDEISEALPVQHTSPLRQDSEAAELVETGQGTADLRALAEQGDAEAQLRLGGMYFAGQAVAEDAAEGVRWWRLAAEQGLLPAQTGLGGRYFNGRGVERDEAEAFRWYRMAAEQGDEEVLAFMHLSAEQGSMTAQVSLAEMYAEGRGVVRDEMEAVRWRQSVPQAPPLEELIDPEIADLRARAEQDDLAAQVSLGDIYDTGEGIAQDAGEAVRWYRRAAERGDVAVQVKFGGMYFAGRGVSEDAVEAVRWFRRAIAQPSLGGMYFADRGVAQDDVNTHMWLDLAAARSTSELQESVIQSRDTVAQWMTLNQIAEAQRLAREWDAAHPREP